MPLTHIPIEREIREGSTDTRIDDVTQEVVPVLKPEFARCMVSRLPAGTTHTLTEFLTDKFVIPGANDYVAVSFKDEEELNREAENEDDEPVVDEITSRDGNAARMVHRVMRECFSGKVDLKGIQKKVETRELKKAFNTAATLQSPSGKQLPMELNRTIAKFVADKKVNGGRKTRKTKKARKQTRRRRS